MRAEGRARHGPASPRPPASGRRLLLQAGFASGLGVALPSSSAQAAADSAAALRDPATAIEPAGTDSPPPPPDCSHCRARLHTLDALRAALPADWTLGRERDPVFGGQVLVVRAGRSEAEPLLIVHGLGSNGFTDWLTVMPALAERYRVIALDLPGYGYSDSPEGRYAPSRYARVLENLLARHAARPARVVAHSMGAAAALRLAEAAPERVHSLVLVSAAGILHRTAFVKHRASLPWTVDAAPEGLKGAVARVRDFGNAVVERLFALPVPDPGRILSRSEAAWGAALRERSDLNAGLALVDEDFAALAHTLQTPVQLIWGDADPIAPVRTGQALAFVLPQAQLHVLAGVDHMPMAGAAVGRFLPLLLSTLERAPDTSQRLGAPPPAGDGPAVDREYRGEVGREIGGHYRELRITGCTGLRLKGVRAERLLVEDSIVELLDVQVRGGPVAALVRSSEFVATACVFDGEVALDVDGSRLDLAGVRVSGARLGVEVNRWSRVIASISEMRSPAYEGWWHDSHELEQAVLVPRRPGS